MNQRDVNRGPRSLGPTQLQAWSQVLAEWLIHRAARSAPPDLLDRLEEEWCADLADRSSSYSRLRFALGCCWATRVIAREHSPANVPMPSVALGSKIALGFVREESDILARRSITLFLVVGLHVALFYALMSGLAFNIIKAIPTSLQTRVLQPPRERALPPLPPPQMTKSRIEVPPPFFPPTGEPIEDSGIVAEPHLAPSSPPETPPAMSPHDVLRVAGGPGIGFPNTDDYYPSIAKRMEEQGVTTVHVCVGANGRLTSDPTIAQTSGSPRLDGGALLLAKAGSGHYRAATEDGRAVNSCYSFRVRFMLRTN